LASISLTLGDEAAFENAHRAADMLGARPSAMPSFAVPELEILRAHERHGGAVAPGGPPCPDTTLPQVIAARSQTSVEHP
jgi:hypothetical protein